MTQTGCSSICKWALPDVQLSADGVPVVIHDASLWRLAGQNLNVGSLRAEELTSLELYPSH